ncbi:MAG TPA: MobF family relaxase, partial [Acidimicrobiales bacterium]|nr:MobF family relaxase [Acidimicrobiales bacterium]
MLSIGKMVAGAERYYLQTVAAGREEYYTGSGEAPGRWLGAGAAELGLAGEVAPDDLRAVLAGMAPNGRVLTAGRVDPARRVTGFDLTWSAPKSVSLLYALGDPATADTVRRVHADAVTEALGYLETRGLRVRRGPGGERRIGATGLVAAAFPHRTSRAGDPQLHTHVLVANVAHGDDGTWSAPDARLLYFHARTAGFLYQAVLRAGLTDDLGVRFGPTVNGMAELADVSPRLLRAFSTRRAAIEEHLAEHGGRTARAAEAAALVTRDPKVRPELAPGAGPSDLRARWQAEVAALGPEILGLADPTLADLLGQHHRLPRTETAAEQLVAELTGPDGLTAGDSTFERRDVVRAVAAALPDGGTTDEVAALVGQVLASPEVVFLPGVGRGGERRHSTTELLAVEAAVLDGAAARRLEAVAEVGGSAVRSALGRYPFLADEQQAMVRRLVTSGAGVDAVVGRAGTGKTTALAAARHAWEQDGYRVQGTALSARAAQGLEEGAGIPSTTLARLLQGLDAGTTELTARDVVVVDEAGMVGTRMLGRLLDRASATGSKVVLVGDPRQLPEIEAGGAFAGLVERLGAIELAENRRQREGWERAALDEVRHGQPLRGLAAFDRADRVHTADSLAGSRRELVARWLASRAASEEVAMLAVNRRDVAALNREARAALRDGGLLGSDVVTLAGIGLAIGDEVVCLRNDRLLDVVNGTRGRVSAVEDGTVMLDTDGGPRRLPFAYGLAGHLDHGYAVTVHKAQGMTVDRAFVLATDSLTREAGYVALSRARRVPSCSFPPAPSRTASADRLPTPPTGRPWTGWVIGWGSPGRSGPPPPSGEASSRPRPSPTLARSIRRCPRHRPRRFIPPRNGRPTAPGTRSLGILKRRWGCDRTFRMKDESTTGWPDWSPATEPGSGWRETIRWAADRWRPSSGRPTSRWLPSFASTSADWAGAGSGPGRISGVAGEPTAEGQEGDPV